MSILLLILKIIGILFLVFLILLMLLLFHPVFYKGKGEIEDKVSVRATVWWLFQIIRVEITVEDNIFIYKVRIFGKIFLSSEKQDKNAKKTETSDAKDDFLEDFAANLEEQDIASAEDSGQDCSASADRTDATAYSSEEDESSFKEKTSRLKEIPAKLSGWKHIFERIKTEYKDEMNRLAVVHIWKEFIYLLEHLKPKYLYANLNFSTGDPATTGQAIGILSLLPIMYRHDVHIYPDFMAETCYIQGKFALKGHMQLRHVLLIFIRIIRDKNIRRMIHRIRK